MSDTDVYNGNLQFYSSSKTIQTPDTFTVSKDGQKTAYYEIVYSTGVVNTWGWYIKGLVVPAAQRYVYSVDPGYGSQGTYYWNGSGSTQINSNTIPLN